MIRLWLLIQGERGRASVILTGDQMQREGIHPLRCIYLGSFDSTLDPIAMELARRLASTNEAASVIAGNVRHACDLGQTRRWRLSAKELAALRGGGKITVTDKVGKFTIGYAQNDEAQNRDQDRPQRP